MAESEIRAEFDRLCAAVRDAPTLREQNAMWIVRRSWLRIHDAELPVDIRTAVDEAGM